MKSMREVNLETYSLSLLTAKEDILNPRSSTNWALFAYDGIMNRLKLADSGGGLKELSAKLHPRLPLYGMCRVGTAQPCIVMILWVGNEVDEYRRAECASHLPAIRAFFKEVHIFLPAHTLDEITEERICSLVYNAAVVTKGPRGRPGRRMEDRQSIVGTNYKRTIAAAEIQRIQRDSFWAQAEREEEERKKEEQRRAAEDRRQRERERMLQEKREAMERERRLIEKEQKIKEQRKIQAQMEAEAHKQQKLKWEHQEKEREEEEMRARYFRSESKEKSAEAAALVSQRVANPREFFRQLSSTSVHTASSPSSPYPVRSPCRQLHRSQTDSIFSFSDSPSSTTTSPYRSPLVSPYFQSIPTSQSPTLFNNTAASSLQNDATISIKSQIHPSSSKIMEPFAVTAVGPTQQLQTQPAITDATVFETESPIGDIIDSLVFYPPPLTAEQLKTNESEMVDEFPPPPPDFEISPELTVNQPETPVDPLDTLMSSFPPSCLLVPEPPTRPLPALPVAPQMLKDLEQGTKFTARALVISTVEEEGVEEENEEREIKDEGKDVPGRDGERMAQEEGKGGQKEEELDGMIMEKRESEKESNGKIMGKCESWKKQDGEMLDEHECGKEQDGKMLEENESGREQDGKMLEEHECGKDQDGKMLEGCVSGKEQDGKMLEEHECGKDQDGKMLEEHECGKDQDGKMLEEHECGTDQDGKMLEEHECGKDQDGKMLEEHECGKDQDGQMLEGCVSGKDKDRKMSEENGSEKDQDGKMLEGCRSGKEQEWEMMEEKVSEKIQNAKIMLECALEKDQDRKITEKHEEDGKECNNEKIIEEHEQYGNIVDVFDNENEQDGKNIEVFVTEKYGEIMEEFGQDSEQYGGGIMDELEVDKIQDGSIMEERDIDKEQDWKIIEEFDSEKIQSAKIMLDHMREKEQDGKSMEISETEQIQYVKRMEECGQEYEQDGKIVEKCEDEHVSEKEQDGTSVGKHEDGKSPEEHESEKKQDWEMIEDCKTEKIQDGDIIEEHESCKEEEIVKAFETEKTQYVEIMEERGQEKEQNRKTVEKCEGEYENEKVQDMKIMQSHDGEEQDGRRLEEQDWERTEEESKKIQYGNIMEDHEREKGQDGMMENPQIQDNERMSRMAADRTVNVTVLRKDESYTEIIKRDEATEEGVELVKSDNGNKKEEMKTPLIQAEEANAYTRFSQRSPPFPEFNATEPSQHNDASIPESISTTQDEPQMSSSPQINIPTIQVESDLSSPSIQRDSDDMKEKTSESVDSQASSKNSPDARSAEKVANTETHVTVKDEQTDAEMLKEVTIVDGSNDLNEGINTESKTSAISENPSRIGQSDEREGLVPVSHFLQDQDTERDLKHCITHQLESTNDMSDVGEGEEAISLYHVRDTDVEHKFKSDSDPDQENEDNCLQNCKTVTETPSDMRNDKTADDK